MTQFEELDVATAIEKLRAGIANASVIQSMTVAGQTFQFRSIEEMVNALAWLRREAGASSGRGTSRLASTSKGA